jgi:hypothetical protein
MQSRLLFDVIALDTAQGHPRVCVAKHWSSAVQAELGITQRAGEHAVVQNP